MGLILTARFILTVCILLFSFATSRAADIRPFTQSNGVPAIGIVDASKTTIRRASLRPPPHFTNKLDDHTAILWCGYTATAAISGAWGHFKAYGIPFKGLEDSTLRPRRLSLPRMSITRELRDRLSRPVSILFARSAIDIRLCFAKGAIFVHRKQQRSGHIHTPGSTVTARGTVV